MRYSHSAHRYFSRPAASGCRHPGEVNFMNVNDVLERLLKMAADNSEIRQQLLETKNSPTPLSDFCRLSTELGLPLYEMDLLSAGEDYYAAMRRSTNGGGENSPLLTGEDDYYELFMEQLAGLDFTAPRR